MTIFTVGHSTHPIGEFIGILQAHGVKKLIDVRTVPKSRHNPQFNGDALAASVRASGITYRRMESLGGLRHARKDSPNGAWRNASFRGYADYMQTEEFSAAIDQLDIMTEKSAKPHTLTSFARVEGKRVWYPPA